MKILVTGATGFLGKHVCKKLMERKLEFTPTSKSMGFDYWTDPEVLLGAKSTLEKNTEEDVKANIYIEDLLIGCMININLIDSRSSINVIDIGGGWCLLPFLQKASKKTK